MSGYPLPKDPATAAYLQHLRERNIKQASVCHYCKKQSTGINSDGYRIIFVCEDHFEAGVEKITDTSNPNIVHNIYPQGMPVDPNMMNPNIGGHKPKDKKIDYEAIWASQISFEE